MNRNGQKSRFYTKTKKKNCWIGKTADLAFYGNVAKYKSSYITSTMEGFAKLPTLNLKIKIFLLNIIYFEIIMPLIMWNNVSFISAVQYYWQNVVLFILSLKSTLSQPWLILLQGQTQLPRIAHCVLLSI